MDLALSMEEIPVFLKALNKLKTHCKTEQEWDEAMQKHYPLPQALLSENNTPVSLAKFAQKEMDLICDELIFSDPQQSSTVISILRQVGKDLAQKFGLPQIDKAGQVLERRGNLAGGLLAFQDSMEKQCVAWGLPLHSSKQEPIQNYEVLIGKMGFRDVVLACGPKAKALGVYVGMPAKELDERVKRENEAVYEKHLRDKRNPGFITKGNEKINEFVQFKWNPLPTLLDPLDRIKDEAKALNPFSNIFNCPSTEAAEKVLSREEIDELKKKVELNQLDILIKENIISKYDDYLEFEEFLSKFFKYLFSDLPSFHLKRLEKELMKTPVGQAILIIAKMVKVLLWPERKIAGYAYRKLTEDLPSFQIWCKELAHNICLLALHEKYLDRLVYNISHRFLSNLANGKADDCKGGHEAKRAFIGYMIIGLVSEIGPLLIPDIAQIRASRLGGIVSTLCNRRIFIFLDNRLVNGIINEVVHEGRILKLIDKVLQSKLVTRFFKVSFKAISVKEAINADKKITIGIEISQLFVHQMYEAPTLLKAAHGIALGVHGVLERAKLLADPTISRERILGMEQSWERFLHNGILTLLSEASYLNVAPLNPKPQEKLEAVYHAQEKLLDAWDSGTAKDFNLICDQFTSIAQEAMKEWKGSELQRKKQKIEDELIKLPSLTSGVKLQQALKYILFNLRSAGLEVKERASFTHYNRFQNQLSARLKEVSKKHDIAEDQDKQVWRKEKLHLEIILKETAKKVEVARLQYPLLWVEKKGALFSLLIPQALAQMEK